MAHVVSAVFFTTGKYPCGYYGYGYYMDIMDMDIMENIHVDIQLMCRFTPLFKG